MKTTNLEAEFAAVLGCKPKAIFARLVALGHFEFCSRCGGCGEHSYCQMYGTTCFGCGGAGKVAVKLTAKLLDTVRVQVTNGKLKSYLKRLARKATAKSFMNRLFDAWEALPTLAADKEAGRHHWSKQSSRQEAINAFCAPLSEEAGRLTRELEAGKRYDKEAKKWFPLTEREQTEILSYLDAIMAQVNGAEMFVDVKYE